MVQMSFTLPHAARQAGRGRRAAARRQDGPGARPCSCTPRRWARTSPSSSSTAACTTSSTCDEVEVVEREFPLLSRQGGQRARSRSRLRRKLVVVGACIGTDAHTVGIDAILNIKGFAGEKGLEYYREIKVVNLGAQVLVPELVDPGPGREGRRRPRQPGGHPEGRPHPQHDGDVAPPSARRTPPGRCRCSSSAARASRRARRRRSASTASSAGARRPARSRSYLVHAARHPAQADRRSAAMTRAEVGLTRHPPPLRALQPRPLRRQPRRRRLLAGGVRRRRDRDVHPHRRRRGAVRVLLRRAVPGAGPGRRRDRDRGAPRARRHAQPGDGLRGARRRPGRPGARRSPPPRSSTRRSWPPPRAASWSSRPPPKISCSRCQSIRPSSIGDTGRRPSAERGSPRRG